MKGNNEFVFNEATMIEAVQEYLAKRMTAYAPVVVSITYRDRDFRVHVKSEEETK